MLFRPDAQLTYPKPIPSTHKLPVLGITGIFFFNLSRKVLLVWTMFLLFLFLYTIQFTPNFFLLALLPH